MLLRAWGEEKEGRCQDGSAAGSVVWGDRLECGGVGTGEERDPLRPPEPLTLVASCTGLLISVSIRPGGPPDLCCQGSELFPDSIIFPATKSTRGLPGRLLCGEVGVGSKNSAEWLQRTLVLGPKGMVRALV